MRRLSQFLLFSFILFSLVYAVFFSPLLLIQDIEVQGTNLPKEEIIRLANAEVGHNLLLYRSETGIQQLKADARIRSAIIQKDWPNRLIIKIDARQPFVNIYDGGNVITLDSTGLVIEINQPDERLIQMKGFSISQAGLGEAIISPEAATLKKGLDLANLVGQTDLTQCLITYEDSHIMLRLGDNWKIKFGSANEIEKQFSAFKTIYDQLIEDGTTSGVIDATNHAVAVFKPFEE